MADMVLCHGGKLKKLGSLDELNLDLRAVLALRLAVLLARNRRDVNVDGLRLLPGNGKAGLQGVTMLADPTWLRGSPLTQFSLEQEVAEWQRSGVQLTLQAAPVA